MRSLLVLLFISFASLLFAQNGTIRGTVIDNKTGETIIGVNVFVLNTSTGTVTDLDGAFSMEIAPGIYTVEISYIGYQTLNIEQVEVKAGQISLLQEVRLFEENQQLEEIVVTAEAVRSTEAALLTLKKRAPGMIDGISAARFKQIGDATAVEAAKRVTGVSIEGGKYVYVRGLGDRYSKTTLNGLDIPGLDPDRNTLQMDIFPTNLLENIMVTKNFTADLPADFTGGLMNIETKSFPEEKVFSVSVSTSFNPQMHFQSDYLTYKGGSTDFLGFDDGSRALPDAAKNDVIPTPISGASSEEVNSFVQSFNPTLGAVKNTSLMDLSLGLSLGNQINLKPGKSGQDRKLGYIFSLSYKSDYKYYDQVTYGEYQRYSDPDINDLRYATIQTGSVGERNFLLGAVGGLAYKTQHSKYRLTLMHLQNGESRAGQFFIDNDGEAVGQSGYLATSDNLEYNQRSLTNLLLNGTHVFDHSNWEIDWRISPTLSLSNDPDIRKTAFSFRPNGTQNINPGAGGNPSRIWRSLSEVNTAAKVDLTRKYQFNDAPARLRFGLSNTYKYRDYEILLFDVQFFAAQSWTVDNPDPSMVLDPANIFPNKPNSIYYQTGNTTPNPNSYQSSVNNTGIYVSNEFEPVSKLKTILGLRAENYVQRHTGRDQRYASGDLVNGKNLDNEKVLESLDLFPSVNLIYGLTEEQNLRLSWTRTIARPSFKEISFAQIIDPITNRIFNGALFSFSDWNGQLTETRIHNLDLRWELFMNQGQLFSISTFFKQFDNPIELVRIPEQQTSTEFQPRNVGNGQVFGVELEIRKNLDFLNPGLSNFNISGNLTLVESTIEMSDREFEARKSYERTGQTIDNTRQMAGQAPYVINMGLSYSHPGTGWNAGVFYNVKGRTLQIVGGGLFPDVYFEPFHSLNLSLNKKLGADQRTSIDFKVSNLLNDRVESYYSSFEAADQVFSRMAPGTAISLGLNHTF